MHFHLEKFKRAKICAKAFLKIMVFDGPGRLSPQIPPHMSSDQKCFQATTFQCTILVFGEDVQSNYFPDLKMSLASIHPQSHSVLRPGFQTRHIYKAHDCPHHICSHQIETQPQYKLNITLLSLTFTGLDTVTCLTGGFRVLNFQAFEEAFCAPISSHATFKKTFYSFFEAAILYLYSYPSYSHIEAEVTVQTTKCKSIDIDHALRNNIKCPWEVKAWLLYLSTTWHLKSITNGPSQSRWITKQLGTVLFSK